MHEDASSTSVLEVGRSRTARPRASSVNSREHEGYARRCGRNLMGAERTVWAQGSIRAHWSPEEPRWSVLTLIRATWPPSWSRWNSCAPIGLLPPDWWPTPVRSPSRPTPAPPGSTAQSFTFEKPTTPAAVSFTGATSPATAPSPCPAAAASCSPHRAVEASTSHRHQLAHQRRGSATGSIGPTTGAINVAVWLQRDHDRRRPERRLPHRPAPAGQIPIPVSTSSIAQSHRRPAPARRTTRPQATFNC